MENTPRLPFPIESPIWALASLAVTRSQLQSHLGEPHFVDPHCSLTCGSEAHGWAFLHPSGQRVVAILDADMEIAEFFGDPPNLETVLQTLGFSADDPRMMHHDPVRMP